MTGDLVSGLIYRATEDHHHCQGLVCTPGERFEERVLMKPEGFPHVALDTIAIDRAPYSSSSSKTNLKGDIQGGFLARDHPVHNPDCPGRDRLHIRPGPVKQCPDESFSLEPKARRKSIGRGLRGSGYHRRSSSVQRVYFVLRVSLTVRFLRPLARRRASTFRPFLEAMRERNPCLFARFRRLG